MNSLDDVSNSFIETVIPSLYSFTSISYSTASCRPYCYLPMPMSCKDQFVSPVISHSNVSCCFNNSCTFNSNFMDHSSNVLCPNQFVTSVTSSAQAIGDYSKSLDLRWVVSPDQKAYYLGQFLRLESDTSRKLSGTTAKAYFELSKLSVVDLCKIWELVDLDRDGQLTLGEFCVAMHLVVLRRNGIAIPDRLPDSLKELIQTNLQTCNHLSNDSNRLGVSNYLRSPNINSDSVQNDSNMYKIPVEHQCDDNSYDLDVSGFSNQHCNSGSFHKGLVSTSCDISSLGEGLTMFESNFNLNPQLKHPIPVRLNNNTSITSEMIPSLVTSSPSGFLLSSQIGKNQQFSICPRVAYLGQKPNSIDNNFGHHSFSVSKTIQPPTPPPRVYYYQQQYKQEQEQLSFSNFNACNLDRNRSLDYPILDSSSEDELIRFGYENQFSSSPKSPSKFSLNPNDLESPCPLSPSEWSLEQKLANLKKECNDLDHINGHLSLTLMNLQKDRISMKILMERMMPLNAN